MFDNFYKYLTANFPLTEEEFALIKQVSIVKKLRKKQYLLQEGDIWRYNAFVSKGLLRTYRVDDKGQEHIIQFSLENWWAGDRQSYHAEEPARYNIDAFEDSEVILISKQDFPLLLQQLPALDTFMKELMERSFIALQNRVHSNITFTAEEKYADFTRSYPAMLNRIPQHLIASFLGITPETLSRIRNQVAKK